MITAGSSNVLDIDIVQVHEQYQAQIPGWSGAVPIENLDAMQLRLLREIHSVASLSTNWDSYQSPPPTSAAIMSAVAQVVRIDLRNLPVPHVAPVSGGGIQLIWQNDERTLDLEILPNGNMEYLTSQGRTHRLEGELTPTDYQMTQALIAWVAAA
jgi:hypothetical protein